MNSKQRIIERETYSMLEWLGDCGGLNEFIVLFGGFLPAILGSQRLKGLITSKLYHLSNEDSRKIAKGKSNMFRFNKKINRD